MELFKHKNNHPGAGKTATPKLREDGQTLIETLAGLFILVTGVSAAVGLAIFAFNSSTSIVKQIVATGLAREGLEAVRNMRDTNWLKDTISVNGCYDYALEEADKANCYPDWLSEVYCIDPTDNVGNCNGSGTTMNYALGFDASTSNWVWLRQFNTTNYGLNFDATDSSNEGFYTPTASGVSCANASGRSDYCRKIIITKLTSAPYNQDTGPLLLVKSQVWWVDKKCPRSADWPGLGRCSVELDTYLANWKIY